MIDNLEVYHQTAELFIACMISKNQLKDRYHHLESLIFGISTVLQ